MAERGHGTLLVTSATAAVRGNAGQHAHAAAMGGRRMLCQALRESRGMAHDSLLLPEHIADTYYHLARQHRSTWTHEIDLRSFSDQAWWNG